MPSHVIEVGPFDHGFQIPGPSRPGRREAATISPRLPVRFGTVGSRLGRTGSNRPLVLIIPHPLIGFPGSTLLFDQRPGADPWTTALKFH